MHFSKSFQKSKSAITMRAASVELTLLLSLFSIYPKLSRNSGIKSYSHFTSKWDLQGTC